MLKVEPTKWLEFRPRWAKKVDPIILTMNLKKASSREFPPGSCRESSDDWSSAPALTSRETTTVLLLMQQPLLTMKLRMAFDPDPTEELIADGSSNISPE